MRIRRSKGKTESLYPKVFETREEFDSFIKKTDEIYKVVGDRYSCVKYTLKELAFVENILIELGVGYGFMNCNFFTQKKGSNTVRILDGSLASVFFYFLQAISLLCKKTPTAISFGGPISLDKKNGLFVLWQEVYLLKRVCADSVPSYTYTITTTGDTNQNYDNFGSSSVGSIIISNSEGLLGQVEDLPMPMGEPLFTIPDLSQPTNQPIDISVGSLGSILTNLGAGTPFISQALSLPPIPTVPSPLINSLIEDLRSRISRHLEEYPPIFGPRPDYVRMVREQSVEPPPPSGWIGSEIDSVTMREILENGLNVSGSLAR